MKILHIINSDENGGAQNLLAKVVNMDAEMQILCLWGDHIKSTKYNTEKVFYLNNLKWDNLRNIIKVIFNSDIIHCHLSYSIYLGACFIFKKKILTEHSPHNNRARYRTLRLLDKLIYNRYDAVIAISASVSDSLKNKKVKAELIHVLDNGVDDSKIQFGVRNLRRVNQDNLNITLGMAARFVEAKDQKFLIKAICNLDKNYNLCLAGDGPLLKQCQQLVRELDVEDRVSFMGHVDKIDDFYKKLDVYVHSANWEGFGLSVVEANFAGLPVIATNIEGLRELMQATPEALFERGNFDDFQRAINMILQDRSKIFGSQITELSKYTLTRHVKELKLVYEQLNRRNNNA